MPQTGAGVELPVSDHPWPDVRRVRHGRISLDVSEQGFRNLAVDGRVLVQEIYPAVRAADWSTAELPDTDRQVREESGLWEVRLRQELPGRLVSTTRLHMMGNEDTVFVDHRLEVVAAEPVNRWGLNLCLNAETWRGSAVEIDTETFELPIDIGPQRRIRGELHALFPATERLALRHPSGARLAVTSSGPRLEVEDQRNWTDPTYKVYSGPLRDPRPVVLEAGSTLRQELRLSWERAATRESAPVRSAASRPPARELPRIGVQLNDGLPQPASELAVVLADLLADLGVDHVRVDAERATARPVLDAVRQGDVELAVLVSAEDDQEQALAVVGSSPRPHRILWHLDQRRTTGAADAAAIDSQAANVQVVPGTDAYFADLNRDRPVVGDAVSFSISPTVHTHDSETVFASLATQAEVVRQARQLFVADVLVSPVTFGIRGAPETSHDSAHRAMPAAGDPRVGTLEGAAWTVGSVHALVCGGAAAGTWHELFGKAGLIAEEEGQLVVRPAFHALAALRAQRRPQVRPVNPPGAPWVALHLIDQRQIDQHLFDQHQILVASLRPWSQSVNAELLDGRVLHRRRLREQDVPRSSRTRRWWATATSVPFEQENSTLDLEPFELTLLDLILVP